MAATVPAHAGTVTIRRDTWGIAHVHGRTDADAVYGMIYAQAEDDFPRIERNYLVSLGRLAEAEGESALWQDLRQRLWVDPAQLQADYARSPAWLKRLMDAWAAGLNAYLADHPQVKPKVITRWEPWMALSFTEGSIGGDIERVPLSQLEAFYGGRKVAMTDLERGIDYRDPQGSNGIAIAPSHSKDGHALLLINPHTSFYFRSEQQVTSDEGLNVYGAATWGQFFIYQGFNAQAGWMHTSSTVDNVDEFAETIETGPNGEPAYRYGKALRPVTAKQVTLKVRGADGTLAERTFTTYATHHGPIVRASEGKWIAFALMNRPIPALQQSFLRTKARDLADFLKVAALQANSSNNTLFADSKGETAYLHPQFMPVRDQRFDYRRPVDGSDPRTDWQGLHPLSQLPQVLNPKNGWAFNVNNWPWRAAGADSPVRGAFPIYMDQVGETARGPHAERVLAEGSPFTLDSLVKAAYDPWLPAFDKMVPGLVAAHARHPDPALDAPVALLRDWDKRWSAQSTATSLAVFWGEALWKVGAEEAEAAEIGQWDWLTARASDEQQLAALRAAVDRLQADFGSWQVPWGEINRFQRLSGAIDLTYDDAKPSTAIPFTAATWGSLAAFGAQRYPGTKRYYGSRGNSFVAAVEFGPRLRAVAVSAGGESGDPASPHFADQTARYAAGDLRPVWFYPEELAGHVTSTRTLVRR
ncbi:penicillin acylase family protein [Novosphingobium cyanobacteriorum]|uniref:Penicillin acylase family protein n=1 Tax=Novosphingobium cyanobacteriorum TaxID=3024215 RepID=A0ABT6CKB9_9SPHN|nr:penicillin acylase family protein [Novosphingobium cyanobacteriorum]MDF8334346.1 penicillin acylase family protein [Novosphingobium cyanobacteriorum]